MTRDVMEEPSRTSHRRLDWVDTGRGIAITLVVLYHAARWFDVPAWQHANQFVTSLRMPFFFAMSGMLAARAVSGSWTQLWRKRISLYLWVFLVFEVIGTVAYETGFLIRGARHAYRSTVLGFVEAPYRPLFELWFIWALALFVVLACLTRRIDWRLQLAVALVPSVIALTDGFDLGNLGWNGSLKYYFFFLVGVHGRRWLMTYAAAPRALRWAVLAAWVVLAVALNGLSLLDITGLGFALSCVGVAAGVSLATTLVRVRPLSVVGANTLPIYVGHTPIIIITSSILIRAVGAREVVSVGIVLIPCAALAALLLARWIGGAVKGTSLQYLYEQPPAIREPHLRVRLAGVISRAATRPATAEAAQRAKS